jgi:hypothetical protein
VHLLNAGASNFQTLERLLSRLALEVFLFGTAILAPPYYSALMSGMFKKS